MKDISPKDRLHSHKIDNKVLDVQKDLAQDVAEDKVSLGEFCDTVKDLDSFVKMQAEFRADGFTKKEGAKLLRAFRERGKDPVKKVDPQLKALYQQAKSGKLSPDELSEELNWMTQKSYGAVVAERSGPVYSEERYKLRAHLHTPRVSTQKSKKNFVDPELPKLAQKALKLFPILDSNQDQVVDRLEAKALLTDFQDLDLTPAEAATLYSRQKQLASVVDPDTSGEKLKREDLERLLPQNFPAEPNEKLMETVTSISKRFAFQKKLNPKTSEPTPFKNEESFQPWNVKQGLEGSCWFLSNLPALTDEDLQDLIRSEGDGFRFTVADGRSTFVEPLNQVEQRVYSKGDGAWSGLMEKGMSQLLAEEGKDLNGGFAKDGRKILSGNKSVRFRLNEEPKEGQPDLRDRDILFQTMEEAFQNGSAIFAAADKEDHEKDISEISASRHAYTVLDVDRETDTVVVRNPWGRSEKADLDGVNNGVFELTQDQFFANFSYIYLDQQAV